MSQSEYEKPDQAMKHEKQRSKQASYRSREATLPGVRRRSRSRSKSADLVEWLKKREINREERRERRERRLPYF
jgi:hypothetical protein